MAICLKRTENLLVAILGVLKAGAAYLPLNPEDPPLRLGRIIAHAAARFTVTDSTGKTESPQRVIRNSCCWMTSPSWQQDGQRDNREPGGAERTWPT